MDSSSTENTRDENDLSQKEEEQSSDFDSNVFENSLESSNENGDSEQKEAKEDNHSCVNQCIYRLTWRQRCRNVTQPPHPLGLPKPTA